MARNREFQSGDIRRWRLDPSMSPWWKLVHNLGREHHSDVIGSTLCFIDEDSLALPCTNFLSLPTVKAHRALTVGGYLRWGGMAPHPRKARATSQHQGASSTVRANVHSTNSTPEPNPNLIQTQPGILSPLHHTYILAGARKPTPATATISTTVVSSFTTAVIPAFTATILPPSPPPPTPPPLPLPSPSSPPPSPLPPSPPPLSPCVVTALGAGAL